jgi:hypothetical protein
MLFICLACRRADYYRLKDLKKEKPRKLPKNPKHWAQYAKEKNGSIINKYADTSFLIARGIL